MSAFEKWALEFAPDNRADCKAAFLAGKAEGIKEWMRRAADIAEQHASVGGISQRIRTAILKEIGE